MTILPHKHLSTSNSGNSGGGVNGAGNGGVVVGSSGVGDSLEENGPSPNSSPVAVGGWPHSPSSTSSNSGTQSSSARWTSSGVASVRETEKRSSPSYDYNDDCIPASSKRRHRQLLSSLTSSVSHRRSNPRPSRTPSPRPTTSPGKECGYNSEDEYSHLGVGLSEEEWIEKDRKFERLMKKKDYLIKKMNDDGSCLFRAVADQIFGDQEMHVIVRNQCMDYISQNSDYFSQYVTEDLSEYVERKRFLGVHGNHLEIQALSEMYNRPIHIYCYSSEPINIFQNYHHKTDHTINVPIRLCYHREVHYNSLVDPKSPSIGVGLGFPEVTPTFGDRSQIDEALRASLESDVERAMLEDKIKATDWEATNEVIEEQVARESYLQWLRDNERRHSGLSSSSSTTMTTPNPTTNLSSRREIKGESVASATVTTATASSPSMGQSSPKAGPSSRLLNHNGSPKAGCSSDRDSPKPCSSQQYNNNKFSSTDYGFGKQLLETTASFLNGLPSSGIFGLDDHNNDDDDWNETDVLTRVLAVSQQEYLDSLKNCAEKGKGESFKSKKKES